MENRKIIEGRIEGKATKRFQLYRIVSGTLGNIVAEADTLTELAEKGRRADWRYQVVADRKCLTEVEVNEIREREQLL